MWTEAIITTKDCEEFVRSMTPLELALHPLGNRSLRLEQPTRVALVAERGILVEAPGRLRWNVAGAGVPIAIRTAEVLFVPSIESREGGDVLVVAPRLERLDFVALPDFFDGSITKRVSEALSKSARIVWAFTKTFDLHLKLPAQVKPARQVDLFAKWGRVRVTEEALVVALSFHAEGVVLLRSKPPPLPGRVERAARATFPTLPDPPEPATRKLQTVPMRKSS